MSTPRSTRRADAPGRRPNKMKRDHAAPPALVWAEDVTGRCARVTAIGGHSLLVENHTGLLDFTDSTVCLGTRGGPLRVLGSALTLRDARPGALIVDGSIRRVELPCQGGDAPDAP